MKTLFQNSKTFLLAMLIMGAFAGGLAGCNTTEGFGKDVEAAGDAISDEAEENKGY